jgi:hypothetical protein
MEKKTNITNYRRAWLEYKKTQDYKNSSNSLKVAGIKQPYRDNILMNAFGAGWLSTNTKIDFI